MTDWMEFYDHRPRQERFHHQGVPFDDVQPMYTPEDRELQTWLDLMGASHAGSDAELREVVLAAFDSLPEQEQYVVEAHLFERLSFADIGDRLGNSVGARTEEGGTRGLPKQMVERIYARGLGRLRKLLADEVSVQRHLTD